MNFDHSAHLLAHIIFWSFYKKACLIFSSVDDCQLLIMVLCDIVLCSHTSVFLLAVLLLLLLLYFDTACRSTSHKKPPPGPRPLPVLGNLLQVDIRRPYYSFLEVTWFALISLLEFCVNWKSMFHFDCSSPKSMGLFSPSTWDPRRLLF